jgi:Zn-dependent membrane protease YugP
MPGLWFYNSNYLCFMLPAFILMIAVQWYVSSAYKRWSQVGARSRITGGQAAQRLISNAGLYQVDIQGIQGTMTDHYDPSKKVLSLSQGVYNSSSVAALAITAHEIGHAMQDQEGYAPLKLRAALVPAVNIGSYLGWILLMLSFFLRSPNLGWVGLIVFSLGAVFALATLPVELNASARARQMLVENGLITQDDELSGVNHVLNAAALTYVAALVTAVLQILYFATTLLGMGGRRRN